MDDFGNREGTGNFGQLMSDTYTLYNETVMDHFMNPRNMGDLKDADGVGEVGAAACGDIMKISQ